MKVSAVITTKDRVDYLKEALDGVLEQTVGPFEIIVVKDGGGGDYTELLEIYGDKVVFLSYEDSLGANYARNMGIDNAQGDVVAFLDDDDVWCSDYIEILIKRYESDPSIVALTCGKYFMDDHSKVDINQNTEVVKSELLLGNTYCGMSGISCLTEKAKRIRLDEELPNGQDWDFLVRLLKANHLVQNITKPLFYYRRNTSGGITAKLSSLDPKQSNERLRSALKHRKWLGEDAYKDRVLKQTLEGISKRKSKLGWFLLAAKHVGFIKSLNYVFSKI